MTTTVYHIGSQAGVSVSAMPIPSSLASWASRTQFTESASPNQGLFSASLADGLYAIFEGTSQPTDWYQAVSIISVGGSEISSVLAILQSGSAISRSPVATNGKLSGPIFIGDAYLDSHGRAFSWLVSPVAGVSVGTVTCKFGGKSKKCPDNYSFLASGTVSLVTIDSVDYWKMKVDLQSSDTVNLIEDVYNWTASLVYSDGKQETKFYGEEWLRKSLTL